MTAPIYLGVDGGGTKTLAVVVREGQVLGQGLTGSGSHQGEGMTNALSNITEAMNRALGAAGVDKGQIDGAVLGLTGADFPEDFLRLREGLMPYFDAIPFKVVNDAEIALVGGARTGHGIVAVCGTGTNVWGLSEEGRSRHVGGLGYEFGDFGGGLDLVREVLHSAFRSDEQRGPKTALQKRVLEALGLKDYDAVSRALYFDPQPIRFMALAPLCFRVAADGDAVAQTILRRMGQALGDSVVGCAKILGLDQTPIEVVMAGSLWLGEAPDMVNAFREVLRLELPLSDPHPPDLAPVAGAALLAAVTGGQNAARWRHPLRSYSLMRDTGD